MITFKYIQEKPFALCLFKHNSNIIIEHILVDSGADITIIPKTMGEALGFKLLKKDHGLIKDFNGFGGTVPVILRKLDIRIGEIWLKEVTIGWSLSEEQGFLVLGRKDVFDAFDIEFQQKAKLVIFKQS